MMSKIRQSAPDWLTVTAYSSVSCLPPLFAVTCLVPTTTKTMEFFSICLISLSLAVAVETISSVRFCSMVPAEVIVRVRAVPSSGWCTP